MFVIKDMTDKDYDGKAYVHYKSWHETYTGIMPEEYLNKCTYDSCKKIAEKYPENTYVALRKDMIVGFACYCECRDDDLPNTGEVMAIYILKEYQGLGLGKTLLGKCLEKLKNYDNICIWVLDGNYNAINFYKHYGFEYDGAQRSLNSTFPVPSYRMICRKRI